MLFTSSTKLQHISKEIDTARCKGQWHTIPDLARRYVKYNPEGTALEKLILAEANLVRLGQTKKPWDPKQVNTIQDQLQSVFELTDNDANDLKESAKVVLACLFFHCQEYDQVLALLDGITLLNAQSPGYSFILFYQSVAIKAMSLEMMGETNSCLQSYEYVSTLLDDRLPIKELSLLEWAELTLYKAIQFSNADHSRKDTKNSLDLLRAYHTATCSQPPTWRSDRRMEITLQLIKLISRLYRSGDTFTSINDDTPTITFADGQDEYADTQYDQRAPIDEIIQLYTLYDRLLESTISVPDPQQSNASVVEFIELLASDLDWIAETLDDLRGYKEVLERAFEKTFNSPCILRHLFLVLIQIGDYEEAQHALRSYLQLTGLTSQIQQDSKPDSEASARDSQGRYIPLPCQSLLSPSTSVQYQQQNQQSIHSMNADKNDNNDHQLLSDSVICQLMVLREAVKLFCKDLENGTEAVEMAELALTLMRNTTTVLEPQQESDIYTSAAIAYSLLASQTIDSARRPIYHEKSLALLQHANDITPNSWKVYYYLAYQYATMRNISQAIECIRQSLNLNPKHIPSWHLLALALSCPGQEDRSQALSVTTMGMTVGKQQADTTSTSLLYSTAYDDEEQRLLLQITHHHLIAHLEGPEKALETHADLFKEYVKCTSHTTDTEDDTNINLADTTDAHSWYGQSFYTGIASRPHNKAPRRLVISGSLGNVPSVTSSASGYYPATTSSSSSLAPSTTKSQKSSRRRSASSSMVSHFLVQNPVTSDAASVMTTTTTGRNGVNGSIMNDGSTHTGPCKSDDDAIVPSSLARRAPSLRKYASNSTLRVPGSSQQQQHHHHQHPSSSHWHGLHLFPSRSASRRTVNTSLSNGGDTVSSVAMSINESMSNDSVSKQADRPSFRHNSTYSFQSNITTGTGGLTTPSIHNSVSTNTSSPGMTLPSLFIPQRPNPEITERAYLRRHRLLSLLCELWQMSAEWFIMMGQHDEALKAISEAESVKPYHPDIWCLLGKIRLGTSSTLQPCEVSAAQRMKKDNITDNADTNGDDNDDQQQKQHPVTATQFFEKGMVLQPHHLGCQLGLAKAYINQRQLCLAEELLISATQGCGWDSAEAWYLLGQIYHQTNRQVETKKCLFYALELESTRPVQSFSVLPRII